MIDLKRANTLMREKKYLEAFEIFSMLKKAYPGFLPYEQGYELARRLGGVECQIPLSANEGMLLEAIHPQSIEMIKAPKKINVVTPVLNGERFLSLSLNSVLSQAGDFFIDYFIKDGGSTDMTLQKLLKYSQKIALGVFPIRCLGIRIRAISSTDDGMYDAIAYGFSQFNASSEDKDILTYINADDVFMDGAFSIAAHIFGETPAEWLCGQVHVIDAIGQTIMTPNFPLSYARADIANGLHDGRSLNFIQQEGTFWTLKLYDRVGGVNRKLRLAGDFDLWCRFANYAELLVVDRPLASFRSHGKQLSKQRDRYYIEVDKIIAKARAGQSLEEHNHPEALQFFLKKARKTPAKAFEQRPGPVCFLNDKGQVREVAYIKRGWLTW
ncbi:MAG: glycosyltransferase [Methylococcus sp.]